MARGSQVNNTHVDAILFGLRNDKRCAVDKAARLFEDLTITTNQFYGEKRMRFTVPSGLVRLRYVESLMRKFLPSPYKLQVRLHRAIIRATLRSILGDDFDQLSMNICAEYGWSGLKSAVMAVSSRRSGKSYANMTAVLALLLAIPGFEVASFSVTLRFAREFLRMMKQHIEKFPEFRGRLITDNALMFEFSHPASSLISRIRAFPTQGKAVDVSRLSISCP
jgi:hypothetical protein